MDAAGWAAPASRKIPVNVGERPVSLLKLVEPHHCSHTEGPNGEQRPNPSLFEAKSQLMLANGSTAGPGLSGLESSADNAGVKAVCPDERC